MQRQAFDPGYVQRLAQFDPETQRDFAAYFGELLTLKLRPRLRYDDLIREVIQETFVRVLRVLRDGGIESPEALGSFVNSVCNNVLFEVYRGQTKFTQEVTEQLSPEAPAEQEMVSAEERCQVHEALAELSEKDRIILCGVFIEDREKDDLCNSLGIDREYLRVLLHRAKRRFRAIWVKRFETKTARSSPIG